MPRPRQTSRPRLKPPEPAAWGLPPDYIAPCARWCPHLPTADTADTTQLPLVREGHYPVTCPATLEWCHCSLFLSANLAPCNSPAGGSEACRQRISPSSLPRSLALIYSWHPLPCSSSHQYSMVSPSSFHHPAMEMDPPQAAFYPSSALLTQHSDGCGTNTTSQLQYLLLPRTRWKIAGNWGKEVGSQLRSGMPVGTTQIPPCKSLLTGAL